MIALQLTKSKNNVSHGEVFIYPAHCDSHYAKMTTRCPAVGRGCQFAVILLEIFYQGSLLRDIFFWYAHKQIDPEFNKINNFGKQNDSRVEESTFQNLINVWKPNETMKYLLLQRPVRKKYCVLVEIDTDTYRLLWDLGWPSTPKRQCCANACGKGSVTEPLPQALALNFSVTAV